MVQRIPRRAVKLHLCRTSTAKDTNIRQAIIDLYGGPITAIGNKKNPGPLYGIHKDMWAALALALTWRDGEVYQAKRERLAWDANLEAFIALRRQST